MVTSGVEKEVLIGVFDSIVVIIFVAVVSRGANEPIFIAVAGNSVKTT